MTPEPQPGTPSATDPKLADIAHFFDTHGDLWIDAYGEGGEAWYEYHPLRLRERYAIAMIDSEPRGTAVDLGCGTGHALLVMKRMGFERVLGVDISDRMVDEARKLVRSAGFDGAIDVVQGDVTDLQDIESGSVDACTALGVIEYLQTDEPLLSEIHRILKPGGAAVIQTRNRIALRSRTVALGRRLVPHYRSKIFFREHRPSDFVRSAEASGFAVERELFTHFYALYPLDVIPGVRTLVRPLDDVLSKWLERFATRPAARGFASMYMAKLRKPPAAS